MRGVFLDQASLDRGDLDFSSINNTLSDWQTYASTEPSELAARLADVEVVVSNKVVLDRQALEQAGRLRLICVAATGFNNVDINAARELGITVCNVRAYCTPSVVQHVFALILMLRRQLPAYQQDIQSGLWQNSENFSLLTHNIEDMSGQTLGIIGYGELGRAVANMARCFGMEVIIAQRSAGPVQSGRVSLTDLLGKSDVVSLHCPLTPQTHNLIDADAFALMKPNAILINVARGGLVDESALRSALMDGRIAGAGIDVLSEEPPVHGNILLQGDIPNLIVTPHIAWASRKARQALIDQVAENIQAYSSGTPRNTV